MAKIRNSHPKQSGGGYERLVGDSKMASIFTSAQSTVISNATELEKIISDKSHVILDLDRFINDCDMGMVKDGAYLCTKKTVKASQYRLEKHEPDFIAFSVSGSIRNCYVVELKDGDAFDTKKSAAEREMLQLFVNHLAPKIPFRTAFYICCFNQMDKEKIVLGFKNCFSISEVMTGEEFCEILGIDYTAIVKSRQEDTADNFKFVVEKMTELNAVKRSVIDRQRKHIEKDAFYDDSED